MIVNIPIWGERYITLWSELCGRSLLSAGNLPTVSSTELVTIDFVTLAKSVDLLTSTDLVAKLKEHFEVGIHIMPEPESTYEGMTSANLISLRAAQQSGEKWCYALADQLFADGSLGWLASCLDNSSCALAWSGMVSVERARRTLQSACDGAPLSLPPSVLAKLTMEYPHEVQQNWVVEDGRLPQTPTALIWVHPQSRAAVIRSHVLGLVGLNFSLIEERTSTRFLDYLERGRVMDDTYAISKLIDGCSGIRLADNSFDYLSVSLDSSERSQVNRERRILDDGPSIEQIQDSVRRHQVWEAPLGRHFFGVPYVLIHEECDDWVAEVICATQAIANQPLNWWYLPTLLGAIWTRLSVRTRTRIVDFLRTARLLNFLTQRLIGYKLRHRSSTTR